MKKKILPVLCAVMCLMNAARLGERLSQGQPLPILGQGLVTLFWLALTVLCLRYTSARRGEKKRDEQPLPPSAQTDPEYDDGGNDNG